MSKVQDPEELTQELSASLTRCVPGYYAGVCVAWVGVICESPLGCCVQWRGLGVPLYSHGNILGRWVGVQGTQTGVAMSVSSSLPTLVPGLWACGSSCSLCGKS